MRNTITLSALLLLSLGIIGCAAFKNGSPPTKFEQQLFTIQTNQVPVVTPSGATNFQPVYTYSPGPVIKDVQTGVGLIPGYGGLVGTGLGALAALWGWIRSSKNYNTGVTLAQSIEAIREVIKALPNGATIDNQLTQWLQQHQADTGTVQSVLTLLENDVSNPDAKAAAQQIISTIQSLSANAVPTGTTVKI